MFGKDTLKVVDAAVVVKGFSGKISTTGNDNPTVLQTTSFKNIFKNTTLSDADYGNYQAVMADFKLPRLLLNEIEYTNSTTPTIGATTDTNLTLTDGFYNSTTLINRLNTLFQPYNVVITLDTYTNKLIFTNTQT